MLFLDSVETSRGLRVGSRAGRLMSARCTGAEKACLAHLSAEQLHRLYPDGQLEQMTPRSLSTLSQLELELELDAVRRRGFAANTAESEDDVGAIAVAIMAAHGIPNAGWCLTVGLRPVRPMTHMVLGEYREPDGARFALVFY